MTAVDPRTADATRSPRSLRTTIGHFVALTKPRIIELLLVTTIPTMILAEGGLPSLALVLATLLGGTLAAASANTLNCVYDADIDRLMHRTRGRPLAVGAVSTRAALVFGLVLGGLSVTWLAVAVNTLSAALALAAIAFYVLVYTMVLKRRTSQNIVWGGAAGCMPVLIGWAAVTGSLTLDTLGPLRRDLLLDAAALLAAVPAVPRRLRLSRHSDAARRGAAQASSLARSWRTAGSWWPAACSCGLWRR